MHVQRLSATIEALAAEHGFSGVVSVDRGGEVELARAYGLAERAHQIPNSVDTRFGIASGAKGLTAVTVYSTVADLSAFWRALFGDKLVSGRWVAELIRPRSEVPEQSKRYGLGFWLYQTGDQVLLMGMDPGVSFISVHDPDTARTHTVISNTSTGAWPIARHLRERLYG